MSNIEKLEAIRYNDFVANMFKLYDNDYDKVIFELRCIYNDDPDAVLVHKELLEHHKLSLTMFRQHFRSVKKKLGIK